MSAVTNTNLPALRIQQALVTNHRTLDTAMGRLSTGQRIQSAADDAAGIAISNRLTSQIQGLDMAVRNANDGISLLQTTDGAAGVLSDMLFRVKELAIQSANDTNSTTERDALQTEVASLQSQIGSVLESTEWNGMKVLKGQAGNAGSVSFHIGPASTDSVSISLASLDTGSLASVQTLASVNVSTRTGATDSLTVIDSALAEIDQARSLWGATSNRLMYAADNAANVSLNSSASKSQIMDTDYAQATADLARALILDQAGAAMLSQANQQPMYVLSLLS